MSAEFDALVQRLRDAGVGHEAARKYARKELGISAYAVDVPIVDEDALEKAIEHEGDKIMGGLGFEIVRFSHPGKTKQTPGIPDRRYYRRPRCEVVRQVGDEAWVVPRRGYSVWWEAKSATGEQRPDQKLFQEMVEACGETYLLGTHEALLSWLSLEGIAEERGGVLELVERRR